MVRICRSRAFDEARVQGLEMKVCKLNAIGTDDYPTPAKRPANSVMDCSKFRQIFGFNIEPWSRSLQEEIKELKHV